MTKETARQVLLSLLEEKGAVALPALTERVLEKERDTEAATRLLVERVLAFDDSGAIPEPLVRALAGTLDAAAVAAKSVTGPDGNPETT